MTKFYIVVKEGDWLKFVRPIRHLYRNPVGWLDCLRSNRHRIRRQIGDIVTCDSRSDAIYYATKHAKAERTDYYVFELVGAITGKTDWVEADMPTCTTIIA